MPNPFYNPQVSSSSSTPTPNEIERVISKFMKVANVDTSRARLFFSEEPSPAAPDDPDVLLLCLCADLGEETATTMYNVMDCADPSQVAFIPKRKL